MRRCIHHTNLGKNAKSHNYSRQIALIQYIQDDQSWAFWETVQKISKITTRSDQSLKSYKRS